MQANLLLVLGDTSRQELIGLNLHRAGHQVDRVCDAEAALARIGERIPDMVLTELTLPGMSGLELARRLREHPLTRGLAIIVFSAQAGLRDRLQALDGGADDFIANPSSFRELLARVAAVLRRRAPHLAGTPLKLGALQIDPKARSVLANGNPVALGPREYPLLLYLMTHAERVHSRQHLLDELASVDDSLSVRTIDARVSRIRIALRPHGLASMIQTVRGNGYCLSERLQ